MLDAPSPPNSPKGSHDRPVCSGAQRPQQSSRRRSILFLLLGMVGVYALGNVAFLATFAVLFNALALDDSWGEAVIFLVIIPMGAGIGLPSILIYLIVAALLWLYQRFSGRLGTSGDTPIAYAILLTPLIIAAITAAFMFVE